MMDFLAKAMSTIGGLPDPLIYSIIAVVASGAVYSTIHHVENWRPRHAKRVKLKGVEGRKVEESLTSWSLGTLARSPNYNVAFAAKKILVERALGESCRRTLLSRLESVNAVYRMEALVTLRYIFDFKHKTRNFQDNNAMLQVVNFAFSHYDSLLLCLNHSIEDPVATRLTIQNMIFLMRTHKSSRGYYSEHALFAEWRTNPKNPLASLETVEGILLVNKDDPTADIFLPEVQQFIYYIGEQNWSLPESYPPRVVERFQRIWGLKTEDRPPAVPFHDPVERWFSDRESDRSDDEEEDEYGFGGYEEFLMEGENGNEEEDRQSIDLLDDEPEVLTPEDLIAYFNAAEEAGLRSQDRRRNARRMAQGNGGQA